MLDAQAASVVISEFLASNSGGFRDQDGDASDWVELYNAGAGAVDLDGWYLTDNANDLDKWRFPATTLGAGEFLVVFASNKDRAVAGSELHTNFAISANGEFLGLVRPDLTIADAFAPAFPPQRSDVSYGHQIETTSYILPGAAANITVPVNGSLGTSWTAPAFIPGAGWFSGTTGVGFGIEQPGFVVNYYEANRTIDTLEIAYEVIAQPDQQRVAAVATASVINYLNTGSSAHFGNDLPFPTQTINEDVEDFVIDARGIIAFPAAGEWTFGVNSDDGFELVLERAGHAPIVVSYPFQRAPDDTIATVQIPEAGAWNARLVFYERGGGAGVEMFAAQGAYGAFDPAMVLVGDTAAGGLEVFHTGDGAGGPILGTDISGPMLGANSSALMRIPFQVDDPLQSQSLILRLAYDDGFVVYLNGVEVARQNAPQVVSWNSRATSPRTGFEILDAQTIGLTQYLHLLQPGNNVLAIQGLNWTAGDSDFLILPTLYGVDVHADESSYFANPTPGDLNAVAYAGLVEQVTASVPHGFYDAPFTVALTSATPGVQIRYTLDGSEPTEVNGIDYLASLMIDQTSTLRARAFRTDFLSAPSETITYLFLSDVVTQSPDGSPPAGWPASWGNNVVDYGMDPEIVNDPNLGGEALINALKAIPSFSLTTDLANLFDPANGIYANAYAQGQAWERPASVELINPDGSSGFQINAGIRIRGGFSRSGDNPKHAFRLFFRDEYEGDLVYPLFGDEGAGEFEKVDLRTAQNYSWSFLGDPSYTFTRDIFSRDTQRDMGQPYTRGRYYHLYLNGLYWGLYQTQERSEAFFAESYLGGDEANYDVVKVEAGPYIIQATDGTLDAWGRLWDAANAGFASNADYLKVQGKNPDGSNNLDYEVLVDVDNLIDYMLVIFYGGNLDAPISAFLGNSAPNNFYAIRDRAGRDGFRFFAHDSEHTLLNVFEDRTGPYPAGEQFQHFNPQWLHQRLMENAEYRLRFADHVQRHFFNGGALTPEKATERFLARVNEVGPAILGESARWGDSKVPVPYTPATWQAAVDNILANFLPGRTAVVLNQLRAAGLFPLVETPSFLVDGLPSQGGHTHSGSELRLLAPSGLVYYTTDGSDPRLPGGGINPNTIVYDPGTSSTTLVSQGSNWSYLDDGSDPGNSWTSSSFNDSSWASGPAQLGYGDGDESTTVGFGADPQNRFITTYFRRTFDAGDINGLVGLRLRLLRDDGAVIYLNGVEVARSNMPTGPITSTTLASATVLEADEPTIQEMLIDFGALRAGANVLAVEIHQAEPTSSDISFDLELVALSSNAAPIVLDETTTLNARAYDSGVWSALSAATFLVNDPAAASNLAITEINYNPHAPEAGELNVDKEDYEFIELRNTGIHEIDLTGVRFITGITFDFTGSAVTELAPGAFVLLVKNPAAFQSRYGDVPNIAGVYGGNLSNGGEQITLVDAAGMIIRDFTYDDAAPWPLSPDGGGTTLNVINLAGNPNSPANWRASTEHGGSPGAVGNAPPTISAVLAQTIDEDTSTNALGFVVGDDTTAAALLSVSATSSNLALVPPSAIVLTGSGANRTVKITPAPDRNGSAVITINVNDGAGGVSSTSFVLTVNPINDVPTAVDHVFNIDEDATLEVGVAGLLNGAIDRDQDALEARVASGPSHGTVDVYADGSFTYIPFANFHGDDSFTYVLNDGTIDSAPATVHIVIASVDDAPVIAPIADQPATEEVAFTFTITATDADLPHDHLTFSLDPGAPAAAQVDPNTGSITWTPTEADGPGAFTITVRATDNSSRSSTRTFTINVAETNRPPVAQAIAEVVAHEGTLVSFAVPATDPDFPANNLTYALGAGYPVGMTINPVTGRVTWTPGDSRALPYTITIRISDNGSPNLSTTQTVSVRVNNVAPTIPAIPNASATANAPFVFDGSIVDPGRDTWSATVDFGSGVGPEPLAVNADRSFKLDHVYAIPGTYTVLVRVTDDDGATGSQQLQVTVKPPLDTTPPRVSGFTITKKRKNLATIAVAFSEAMVPSGVLSHASYRLVSAGRDKKFGTKDDKTRLIGKVAYDSARRLAILTPSQRIALNQPLQLVVRGWSSLTDLAGNILDGDADGTPGGDHIVRFGAKPRR